MFGRWRLVLPSKSREDDLLFMAKKKRGRNSTENRKKDSQTARQKQSDIKDIPSSSIDCFFLLLSSLFIRIHHSLLQRRDYIHRRIHFSLLPVTFIFFSFLSFIVIVVASSDSIVVVVSSSSFSVVASISLFFTRIPGTSRPEKF